MIKDITSQVKQLWSLMVGLKITGKEFLKPTVTVHYPRTVIDDETQESFAGHIELVGKPKDPATPKCISCMACMRNCPSQCITVIKRKKPKADPNNVGPDGKPVKPAPLPKNPLGFTHDYSLCSLCGTCIDSCPVDSIRFSNNIYLTGLSREDFNLDLLERLKNQAEAGDGPKA